MEKIVLLLVAVALVVLGARGTYKAVWNQFFPNEPIVTTPVSTLPSFLGGSTTGGNSSGGGPSTPVQAGAQAATATKNFIGSLVGGATSGGTNTIKPGTPGNASNVPSVNVQPGKVAVISTGVPSWWPSWLPYPAGLPHPGAGYTGQQISAP